MSLTSAVSRHVITYIRAAHHESETDFRPSGLPAWVRPAKHLLLSVFHVDFRLFDQQTEDSSAPLVDVVDALDDRHIGSLPAEALCLSVFCLLLRYK